MLCQWDTHGCCKLCKQPKNNKNLQVCKGYKGVTHTPQPSMLIVLSCSYEQLEQVIQVLGKPPQKGCSEKSQWARKTWIKNAIDYLALQK